MFECLSIDPASAFARYTCKRRQQLGLSMARAAKLSGLELSEWYALESGWVPEELDTIRAIADALQIDWKDLSFLSCFASSFQQGMALKTEGHC